MDGQVYLVGMRCDDCGYAVAFWRPRCPLCKGRLAETRFGPEGIVWSATVVHVPIADQMPPYGLAYVDLDNGPRILAHTISTARPLAVGTRVRLVGTTGQSDMRVEPVS